MSKKSLMFVIITGLAICGLRQASAVSSKEKVAFIQELDARLSNPEEVGIWIKKHPDIAKEVFYEIAFDEVWVRIPPVFGEHPTSLTKENWKCLESIRDGLALSPSHLTWLQSWFNRDVKRPVMPNELLPLNDVTKQFAALANMATMEVILGQYQDAESHLQAAFSRLDGNFQRLLMTKDPIRLDHLDKEILREVGHALN